MFVICCVLVWFVSCLVSVCSVSLCCVLSVLFLFSFNAFLACWVFLCCGLLGCVPLLVVCCFDVFIGVMWCVVLVYASCC